MRPGDNHVGRHPACDVVVPDRSVSRHHATLEVESNAVTLRDLGSRNGVWVNGKTLRGRVRLGHGDRIRLGARELVLRDRQRIGKDRSATRPEFPRLQRPRPRGDEATDPALAEPMLALWERAAEDGSPGMLDRAERELRWWIRDTRESEMVPDERIVRRLAVVALDIAERRGRYGWLEPLFAACANGGHVLDASIVDRLERLADVAELARSKELWGYVSRLRARGPTLAPMDRRQLVRLERLAGMRGGRGPARER